MFEEISILAPGLLGASLGQAVAREGLARRVVVWARRPEVRLACQATDWCDDAPASPNAAVRSADLVVLCAPVGAIVPLLERVAPDLAPGALVTDVGSTKSLICRQAQAVLGSRHSFVGSHPMAGSEQTGMENASPDLFVHRHSFVTPLEETPTEAVSRIAALWTALRMTVTTVSPERHDEIVASISHLPHLLASSLCVGLREKDPAWTAYAGNGLRDTTRIAAGSPPLWREICEQNRDEILRSLVHFESGLQQIRSALENRDYAHLQHLLELGRQYRQSLGDAARHAE